MEVVEAVAADLRVKIDLERCLEIVLQIEMVMRVWPRIMASDDRSSCRPTCSDSSRCANRILLCVGRREGWHINVADVRSDLSDGKGRPKWILSAYGPGRNPPGSLLESNEYSPEELRVRFYEMAGQGEENQADQEAIQLWNKATQDINQVLNNANDIEKFMEEADKKHPNRDDFTKMDGTKTRDQFTQEAGTSGSSTGASGSGFGQSSTPNPFAKPAASTFGQPSQPSVFGTPSSSSSPFSKPAFGQTGFGANTTQSSSSPFGQGASGSGFGSPSSGAFGKPAFGSPGFGQSSFGQPSQPTSSFGQPSQPTSSFGQPSQPTSTFGQPPQPTSSFGQPSQPSSSGFGQPAFGSTGFGGAAQKNPFAPASASAGFGQGTSSSTFGQSTQPTSSFGQPSQPTSTFGQASQPTSTFGQASQPSSTFGQPPQPTSSFGQPSQPTSTFGQPSAFGKTGFGQSTSTFGQPSQPSSSFGQATQSPASTFGQAASTSSGFGQPSQPGQSTFGQPGLGASPTPAFGQPSAPANPFGTRPAGDQPNDQNMDTMSPASSRPVSRANPFDMSSLQSTGAAPSHPPPSQPAVARPIVNTTGTPLPLTGRPPYPMHYTQTLPLQPPSKDGAGRLTSYRGQSIQYIEGTPCYRRPDGRGWEKIWFPDAGATLDVVALNREDKILDTQGSPDEYTAEIKDAYTYLFDQGSFKDGRIPLVPPMREWGVYDF